MKAFTVKEMYTLSETIAASIFDNAVYPWEVLKDIKDFIMELGKSLPEDKFEKRGDNIWIAKSATIAPTACLNGPLIIDEEAEIRHCAFIRGSAIVGKKCVVGNSTELKNVILFNKVQVPHYNYVGDSILGDKAHMGAGSILSNFKAGGSNVVIHADKDYVTGLRKIGAILGDYADIGCGAVLNPGTIIGKGTRVYPLTCCRGIYPENAIVKSNDNIVEMK